MPLTGIQIYKLLPQTNCKECGFPTCLAFAMKLGAKQAELAACPYVSETSKTQLAESAAPPMRLVTLKGSGSEVKVGNEVVVFRHDKTFYNPTGMFLKVRDDQTASAIQARVAQAEAYKVSYVGVDLMLDGYAIEAVSGSPEAFAAAVQVVRQASKRPLILISTDPAVLAAGLKHLAGESPLLYTANAKNWEAMATLAKQYTASLAVAGETLDDLADLTQKIKACGVEDMVLAPGGGGMGAWLARSVQIRRLALKKNFRPLGYPTIAFAGDAGVAWRESIFATQAITKYAGFVVLDTFAPETLYPLLVLRKNIYTDPQKPIQMQPGLYEINEPRPEDPVLVTTNFSITYFSVANEVEGSGNRAWLLVTDSEGMSVLTAWAAGKFDADRIAKIVRSSGVAERISKKRIVLPGFVAVLSGDLEEQLPGWEIRVGPRGSGYPQLYEAGIRKLVQPLNTYQITFQTGESEPQYNVEVPEGTVLSAAARLAGMDLSVPCGGQGRCGRCSVQVVKGNVHRRSTVRLSPEDIARGYALSCQTTVAGDVTVLIPPQEKIESRLTTNLTAAAAHPPAGFSSPLRRVALTLQPPSLDNQIDDWSRLKTALRLQTGVQSVQASLAVLRHVGAALRQGDWTVTAVIELPSTEVQADALREVNDNRTARLVALVPGYIPDDAPLWGAAVDIGTTTATVWLVDLVSGQVRSQAAEYNGQIARGEDVISRIMYASRDAASRVEMQSLILDTLNALLEQVCQEAKVRPEEIVRVAVAANSTMTHLFLGIPAESIRLLPFIPLANNFPLVRAAEIGLKVHAEAMVDCLPGVASYVGSDISAGVLACGLDQAEEVALFMDVGTNGETVLGSRDWMVTCACSAGPAFEGAGVQHGMRASAGAIEETWINSDTLELTYRTIGKTPAHGLCGSGLISLLSELFGSGIIDKAGHFTAAAQTPRLRQGEHGLEFVVAWGNETDHGQDIVITPVDIDNLLRAKAAMFAGFDVLAAQVGLSLDTIQQVLVGGSFGRYINIETAVHIGLLPDLPWDHFKFLGNTAVRGAYYALVDGKSRARLDQIAAKMTYIELSADNSFYHAFMSAMFLPHTDLTRFPSVK